MHSTATAPADDRTAKARIRDAAVATFAEHGIADTTARKVAAAADVSPGLVMHHFGSMDGLRAACDEHVAAIIRDLKSGAMAAGAGFDLLGALRSQSEGPPYTRYLAKTLVDGSPRVAALVDELVNDAVDYIAAGVETGMISPSSYPRERAVVLVLWSLGGLVLHEHFERLLGVDLTEDFSHDPEAAAAYIGPVLELFSDGFITDTTVRMMRDAFVDPSTTREKDTE